MGETIKMMYKELFTIRCTHSAYVTETGSSLFEKIKMEPDKATRNLFRRYDIGFRWAQDGLTCFVRSERVLSTAKEPQKLFISMVEPLRLRFLMMASPTFVANTFVISAGSDSVYYFTNKTNNIQGGKKHISLPIENYSLSKNYDFGTLVTSSGDLFTTIQPVSASAVIPLSNTLYWRRMQGMEQVVNNADVAFVTDVKNDEPCFGVIDVHSDNISNADYRLFTPAKEILSPVYHLSFKSKI